MIWPVFLLAAPGCLDAVTPVARRLVDAGAAGAVTTLLDAGDADGSLPRSDLGKLGDLGAGADLVGSGGGSTTVPGAGPGGDLAGTLGAERCVATINALRATEGRPPLQRWQAAEPCADDAARIEAETGVAHISAGSCGEAAQNLCPGFAGATPEQAVDFCLPLMWAEGPGADFARHGHYLNMASSSFTKVACGFHRTASGSMWFVSDFR